ncbi:unnamed protein product [Oikopleura dioica]|uniref:Carbohydrate sulfotransferase n=1 Tax=Oikopleura dioica TaxID=34765 RepID=E4XL80_OIKDI|nr:unnamed protein product [Oikopleura dioica]
MKKIFKYFRALYEILKCIFACFLMFCFATGLDRYFSTKIYYRVFPTAPVVVVPDYGKASYESVKSFCLSNRVQAYLDKNSRAIKGISSDNISFSTCLIPKSGSTTLMATMLASSGFINLDDIRNISCGILSKGDKRYNPDCNQKSCLQPLEDDFKIDFSFLLIRHPLKRLYSAWSDKIARKNTKPKFRRIQRFISPKTGIVSFQLFLEWLLIGQNHMSDIHWKPVSKMCPVCEISWDAIYDTKEIQFALAGILAEINPSGSVSYQKLQPMLEMLNNHTTSSTASFDEEMKNLRTNHKTTLEKIIKLYKTEIELFGYNT